MEAQLFDLVFIFVSKMYGRAGGYIKRISVHWLCCRFRDRTHIQSTKVLQISYGLAFHSSIRSLPICNMRSYHSKTFPVSDWVHFATKWTDATLSDREKKSIYFRERQGDKFKPVHKSSGPAIKCFKSRAADTNLQPQGGPSCPHTC